AWEGTKRALGRGPRTVTFHHQVDDPWSHLLAQALVTFRARFPAVDLRMVVVPPPAADADPEPQKRRAWALRDATALAARHGLHFPTPAELPAEDRLRRANAVLLLDRPVDAQLDAAIRVGDALFRGDGDAVAELVRELGTVPGQRVRPALESNYARLRKAGHYQGAMLEHDGEWFWGVDRLPYLAQRVGGEEAAPLLPVARREAPAAPGEPLEVFFSFRSPYSYLTIARLWAAHQESPLPLRLRPLLPMVTRGLPVPRDKRLYIVKDAKREADRLGLPFGRICDPLGEGVERCLRVFLAVEAAEGTSAALRFAAEAYAGIWSRAVDVASDAGLAEVAAAAEVEAHVEGALATEGWRQVVEANRDALSELGLWGVPSFRHGDWIAWGNDRLDWALERCARPPVVGG
ncbi:MAG TPA: DsbA family protein, partial [Polyangiaceae bacterium LLY-WYZ-15_(1-7)]|nr:DsbA family protein [Polyangiaceae bacterium LLY-WYZ-15_(1-7)]